MNAATAKVKLAPQRQREEMMNDECEMMNETQFRRDIHHSSFRIHHCCFAESAKGQAVCL